MKVKDPELLTHLIQSLEELVKVYRSLLTIVRKEKEILITADLDQLSENNKAKESLVVKMKRAEDARILAVEKLSMAEGLDPAQTKLLDFAMYFGGEEGEKLRSLHAVIDLLIKRVRDHNKGNEALVNSALTNITGAMRSIKDSLADHTGYEKGGHSVTQQSAGQLVRREV